MLENAKNTIIIWLDFLIDKTVAFASWFSNVPIDIFLLMAISFMFVRLAWVMWHRTRVWDNLSRALVSVFLSTSMVYFYATFNALTDDFKGQQTVLWFIRGIILMSVIWCQYELSKELAKVPSVLFVRDRVWVSERIINIERIRDILVTLDNPPYDLIERLNIELDEMKRFKQIVREEDRLHEAQREGWLWAFLRRW